MTALWPHQQRAVSGCLAAIGRGETRICLTVPTGGGKTRIMTEIAKHFLAMDQRVSVYTLRRLLIEQLSRVLETAGLYHGVRAAGHREEHDEPLQLSSLQTEYRRCVQGGRPLHRARVVMLDECHLFTARSAEAVIEAHVAAGAVVIGLTATPLDLGDIYDVLIQAGTTSELRGCGALVPATHYGPTEPDLSKIGPTTLGDDLTEDQNVKAVMAPGIFGHVFDNWQRLNPAQKPTILFAPGVRESIWFAEQFFSKGVPSAHIDGEEVWVNGTVHRSRADHRDDIIRMSETGRIKVLCNRFVLREGIDCPWLGHGIFATVFGSLQSYLQSGGRLLRAHPSLSSVTVQDHGGNWHRHGSLNADRHWHLGDTARIVSGGRAERLRGMDRDDGSRPPREPVCCPRCRLILNHWRCKCGFVIDPRKKSRPVVMADGRLREVPGDVFVPRETKRYPNTDQQWKKAYYGAKKGRRTFAQAVGYFFYTHGYYPPPTLPLMPRVPEDYYRCVADVPPERLH